MSSITEAEKQQYYQTFSQLGPNNGYLSGNQVRNWLVESTLPYNWLEKIWDLCDIDKDGKLDFDEFSVTLRLVNDLLRRVYPEVPATLPMNLIPPSKLHYLTGTGARFGGGNIGAFQGQLRIGMGFPNQQQAFSPVPPPVPPLPQIHQFSQVPPPVPPPPQIHQFSQIPPPVPPPPSLQSSYGSFPAAPLSDDFDWYMPPADKFNYENQYTSRVGPHGYVRFNYFEDLYQTLGVPRDECITAWNLADVNYEQQLGKDACLLFLHILNQRSKGKRIPNGLPNALRTSLLRGKLNYNYNETLDPSNIRTSRSDAIGSGGSSVGTRREEEELLRQLGELNDQLKKAEEAALNSYTSALTSSASSSTAVSELRQLYEFKQQQLSGLQNANNIKSLISEYLQRERAMVREFEDNIASLNAEVAVLETHSQSSERELDLIKSDLESAKLGR